MGSSCERCGKPAPDPVRLHTRAMVCGACAGEVIAGLSGKVKELGQALEEEKQLHAQAESDADQAWQEARYRGDRLEDLEKEAKAALQSLGELVKRLQRMKSLCKFQD